MHDEQRSTEICTTYLDLHIFVSIMENCLNSLKACCITLRKMNSKPGCLHGWEQPNWPSLEHKDQLGALDFWKDLADRVTSAEAREGWCSCRTFREREPPALGVLKGLSPPHFKRCQCFYVLMCSLTQPASPGTGLLCHSVHTEPDFSSSLVLLVL